MKLAGCWPVLMEGSLHATWTADREAYSWSLCCCQLLTSLS